MLALRFFDLQGLAGLSSITEAKLQQKLLHILAPRTQHRTELSSQSDRCSSDVSSLKSPTVHVLFMHLMYSNTVFKQPLEVQCIRVTLVSRVKENMLKK